MEIRSRLKDVEMMRMKMKNPPLDQTGGPREEELEKNLNNFDQLYAYLKQHEVHANENRTMMERFLQLTNDPLALVSNASTGTTPKTSNPDDSRKHLTIDNPNSQRSSDNTFLITSINNNLAYLSGGESSQTYATSVIKIKAADYGHIKWIKDFVPNLMEYARDFYSRHRILAVTKLVRYLISGLL
ncbi:hypothetical protein Tco_0736898 [Tanacetum coccineum]